MASTLPARRMEGHATFLREDFRAWMFPLHSFMERKTLVPKPGNSTPSGVNCRTPICT